tara:strand:+ start:1783 stop:2541 length:759 start_codon:yes stop_codon:yes gene_type:complete
MINNKLIYISVTFSLLFHFTVIFFFTSKTNDKEVYVVNLSEFRDFSFVQPAPPKPKKIIKKKIEDKPIERNKILDNKKKETEKKKDVVALKKEDIKEKVEKVNKDEKVIEPNKKNIQKEEVKKINNSNAIPDTKPQIQSQKQFSLNKNKSIINDKLLSEYLSYISYQINKMASKSYPIQSIKRREQGTIVSVLTINRDGKLINIEIKDRAPKRLYKATTKILNLFKFPKPPAEILDNKGYLRIKIPVNYILR